MPRTIDPLAAYLDAQVDAHNAGLTDDEVEMLQDIGGEIADLAASIAARLSKSSDARMVTRWEGRCERRAAKTFTAEDLLDGLAEGALGELDAYAVIRTAAALRLMAPAVIRAAA